MGVRLALAALFVYAVLAWTVRNLPPEVFHSGPGDTVRILP